MALLGTEEIRNGIVVLIATGAIVTVAPPVVQMRNGLPTDADGRLVVV